MLHIPGVGLKWSGMKITRITLIQVHHNGINVQCEDYRMELRPYKSLQTMLSTNTKGFTLTSWPPPHSPVVKDASSARGWGWISAEISTLPGLATIKFDTVRLRKEWSF